MSWMIYRRRSPSRRGRGGGVLDSLSQVAQEWPISRRFTWTRTMRFTVPRLMFAVAWAALGLTLVKLCFTKFDPFWGFSTIYAEGYGEEELDRIRFGMSGPEVE